ncbi:AsnC family transcriptional regulator [Rhizobium mesoamericanum]|uniref:AsnC family transcriptional regulator n=1 Tax=Rhizobium mesoamericanum TaxID=1079800 RepID=UPI0012FA5F6A|nr:Lrp/AsnC family transcriptional regulator [Rhizobium mesoamericanum]
MDGRDARILATLDSNAPLPMSELARLVGMFARSVSDRVPEANGIIRASLLIKHRVEIGD